MEYFFPSKLTYSRNITAHEVVFVMYAVTNFSLENKIFLFWCTVFLYWLLTREELTAGEEYEQDSKCLIFWCLVGREPRKRVE